MRAAFHLHSALSYDGQGTPQEWARWAKSWGIDVLVFTEHQGAELGGLPEEVDGVRFIWTLELEDQAHHWVEVFGLTILLHPGEPSEPQRDFDLYEAWNLKRDGPFPSKRVLRRFPGPFLAGCDSHAPRGEPVVLEFEGNLAEALREGNFLARRGRVVLRPDGQVEASKALWELWELKGRARRAAVKAARAVGLSNPLRALRKWWARRR